MPDGSPTLGVPSALVLPALVVPAAVLLYTAGGIIQPPDAKLGSYFKLAISDGVALTFPLPLNLPVGQAWFFYWAISSIFAGALGAVTFAAGYKTSATLLTDIAGITNGNTRMAAFVWDGLFVRELPPVTRSVPT